MTASFDLCKQLDELSGGWGRELEGANTNPFFWVQDGGDISVTHRYDKGIRNGEYPILCPAYALDYLLQRLPPRLDTAPIIRYENHWLTICRRQARWQARYGQNKYVTIAPTPTDAACRLAIELFKQGVLK